MCGTTGHAQRVTLTAQLEKKARGLTPTTPLSFPHLAQCQRAAAEQDQWSQVAHALEAQAPAEAARVLERKQDIAFLHGKIEQYAGVVADLEAQLRTSGYTRDLSHHALVQESEVSPGPIWIAC